MTRTAFDGLADAVIKLSGRSSGTAVTNRSGFYDALVDPGKYTVHVESVGGQTATGSSGRVLAGQRQRR